MNEHWCIPNHLFSVSVQRTKGQVYNCHIHIFLLLATQCFSMCTYLMYQSVCQHLTTFSSNNNNKKKNDNHDDNDQCSYDEQRSFSFYYSTIQSAKPSTDKKQQIHISLCSAKLHYFSKQRDVQLQIFLTLLEYSEQHCQFGILNANMKKLLLFKFQWLEEMKGLATQKIWYLFKWPSI